MATAEQIRAWIDSNQDKAGTPDFVTMTDELNKLQPTVENRGAYAYTDQGLPIGSGTGADSAPNDPYSAGNTAMRVGVGAATGIPDLLTAIGNAGVRAGGEGGGFGMAGVAPGSVKQAPYLGSILNRILGKELPPDASTTRQLLEGGGSALLGGGATGVARAAAAAPSAVEAILPALSALSRTTVAPTVGSHYGGTAGGYVGGKLGDAETGSLLGSILGGAGPSAAPGAYDRYRHGRYAGQARPDAPEIAAAAQRQGVEPTAGMLGNSDIINRERQLSGTLGARSFIEGRRRTATEQISDAIDRAATARGSTDPQPTPGTIGYDVRDVARTGAEDLAARSSRGQQQLQTRIGGETDTDISGVLAAMEGIRGRTDPLTAAPIDARLDAMRAMLPRDADGNIISPNVAYQRIKDWRTGLRQRAQGYDAVPGRYAGEIYDATTGAMRQAGESQGVPGAYFDTVQERSARTMGEGGPHEQLTAVAEQADPTSAYSYLKGGEQNPQRLRLMENTGNPAMDRIFGDYLRLIGNDTFNNPNQSAAGPRQYATRIERMHPEALDAIAGAPGTPSRTGVADTATLARAFNYPTSGTGLTKAVGGVGSSVGNMLVGAEALGHAGSATGLPFGGSIGRVAGLGIMPGINYLRARALQGPTAINAMGGGAAPQVMSIQDLAAALTAANSQRGPGNGIPR